MSEELLPLFDDTRSALAFALNFKGTTKAPVMSSILATLASAPRRLPKAARRRFLRQFDGVGQEETLALATALLDEMEGMRRAARSRTLAPPPKPKGLDGAHMAGFILAHFARLDPDRQAMLKGRCIVAYQRCNCGSTCCSKWRRDLEWWAAVRATCLHLERMGDVLREGKRGLSSQPDMRVAIVEQYYTGSSLSLTDLARIGGVTMVTAGKHKEWVCAYLKQEEDAAWMELDAIFDAAGITGAFC